MALPSQKQKFYCPSFKFLRILIMILKVLSVVGSVLLAISVSCTIPVLSTAIATA